jgi:uncharacterized membrane protein
MSQVPLTIRLLLVWFWALFACLGNAANATTPSTALKGYIDSVRYNTSDHTLTIKGWAWNSSTNHAATQLKGTVKGRNFEVAISPDVIRTDVQNYLGTTTANLGFATTIPLHQPLPGGTFSLEVIAVFADGLTMPFGNGVPLHIQVERPHDRHWILLALVIICIFLAYIPRLRNWSNSVGDWIQTHPQRVSGSIAGVFLLLVTLGITGSSWQLLAQGPDSQFADFESSQTHIFKPRQIRADEWSVLTANVLAQWNHSPRFPIVNTNLGLEGQNMGVIGMVGVPIAQPSALARPATWGYFFLPLRQAMAWQWQLPFFACLFFFWKALNLLRPRHFSFCVAPYAVGWSLWPLYASFFPLALFVLGAYTFFAKKLSHALPLGLALGILFSGWVLVLYPPWQISLGTLILVLTAGWLLDNKKEIKFGKIQFFSFSLALLIAIFLISSWWADTGDAVAKIQATAYPGARSLQQGGDLNLFWALRGYSNPENITFGTGSYINESEVSAYILFPIPIFLLGLWLATRRSSYTWALRACIAFLIFWLIYRFLGIPLWFAKISLWSYVTSTRLDLSLGLACTLLMSFIYQQLNTSNSKIFRVIYSLPLAALVSLSSAGLVVIAFHTFPPGTFRTNSLVLQGTLALAIGTGAWWMMRGKIRSATCMMLVLSLVATLGFNPLSLAPKSVKISPASAAYVADDSHPGQFLRTLVISDNSKAAMVLAATGVPVVNGVLYYPHKTLWEKMGLSGDDWQEVNRYQHLKFTLGILQEHLTFKVSHPTLDVVSVTVDPHRFSFASTGARRIASQEDAAAYLRNNPDLTLLGHADGWFWFDVQSPITRHITAE